MKVIDLTTKKWTDIQRIHAPRLQCGCLSDDLRWLEMCKEHYDECNEIHERWNADYRAKVK